MYSYKRLEKLCGEVFNEQHGVTAYINAMKNIRNGSLYVYGWRNDFYKLEHLHKIRNYIAHDPNCNEENMCSSEDALWLDNFYNRMLSEMDPLALYAQEVRRVEENKRRKEEQKRLEKARRISNEYKNPETIFSNAQQLNVTNTQTAECLALEDSETKRKEAEDRRNEIASAKVKAFFVFLFAAIAIAAWILFIFTK